MQFRSRAGDFFGAGKLSMCGLYFCAGGLLDVRLYYFSGDGAF